MKQAYRKLYLTSIVVTVVDWIAFNAAMLLCVAMGLYVCYSSLCPMYVHRVVFNVAYIISVCLIRTTLHHQWSSIASILRNVFGVSLLSVLLNVAILGMAHLSVPGFYRTFAIFVVLFVVLFVIRIAMRKMIALSRYTGHSTIQAVIIGNEETAADVIRVMNDRWNGYTIVGMFSDDHPADTEGDATDGADVSTGAASDNPVKPIRRMGTFADVRQWLHDNDVDEVFICLKRGYGRKIRSIVQLCANKMIRVYYVPSADVTLNHSMHYRDFGDTRIIARHNEPLMSGSARLVKRLFDIAFSGVFLCTLFPIVLIVVTIVTKVTMPGPVFFRQRRTGYDGKDFWCYKFRSMKVNNRADTLQATRDDDRITRWGKIMRHTNIDETPQFWNVFIGDMSVVGPRPHMLAHTEYYSEKIADYMVRHYVRPGITGWAQTNGERGQTETVRDMERRVERDIWYIEHWSFWLDLQIIIKTVQQGIMGDDKAY